MGLTETDQLVTYVHCALYIPYQSYMHRCKKLRRTVSKFPDNQYIAKLSPSCQNVEGHDPNKIEKSETFYNFLFFFLNIIMVGDLVEPSYAQKRKRNINLNICIHFAQYCFATWSSQQLTTLQCYNLVLKCWK